MSGAPTHARRLYELAAIRTRRAPAQARKEQQRNASTGQIEILNKGEQILHLALLMLSPELVGVELFNAEILVVFAHLLNGILQCISGLQGVNVLRVEFGEFLLVHGNGKVQSCLVLGDVLVKEIDLSVKVGTGSKQFLNLRGEVLGPGLGIRNRLGLALSLVSHQQAS